jgi:hypothetical protein
MLSIHPTHAASTAHQLHSSSNRSQQPQPLEQIMLPYRLLSSQPASVVVSDTSDYPSSHTSSTGAGGQRRRLAAAAVAALASGGLVVCVDSSLPARALQLRALPLSLAAFSLITCNPPPPPAGGASAAARAWAGGDVTQLGGRRRDGTGLWAGTRRQPAAAAADASSLHNREHHNKAPVRPR